MHSYRPRVQDINKSGQVVGSCCTISFVKSTWGGVRSAIFGSMAAVLFGLAILFASVIAVTDPASVYPHEGEVTASSEAKTRVEYYLPYPGVLPDSPLYRLKAVRDRLVLMTTFDEQKKAEKELLYADKRINSAIFLVDGGKKQLGVSTATKGEKYLESAVKRAEKMINQDKDVKSLLNKLITASAKHVEILEDLKLKVDGSDNK